MWVDVGHVRAADWALRGVAVVGTLAGVGALAFALFADREEPGVAPVSMDVAGERVELGAEPRATAARVAHEYLERELRVRAGSFEQRVSRRNLGARVDLEHLTALLRDAASPESALRRVHGQVLGRRALQLPMPIELDAPRALALLTQLKDRVDRPAVEARIDPRTRRVSPERAGTELDVYASLERLNAALRGGDASVTAVVRSIAPQHSARALQQLELAAVLGNFETRTGDESAEELKLAAARIDGFLLAPGATFDFDAVVADHAEPSAIRPEDATQLASTLHAAVFFAGLPILARAPQPRPSFWIKLGLDAAVTSGSDNLRFQNDRPYPVVLGMTVDAGRAYASVHGRARDRSVIFERRIADVIPFEERTSVDAKLPNGMRVLEQRGIPGFKVSRVRIIRDPATQQDVRESSSDSYAPTPQLWRIGIGGEPRPGFERPRNDPHPEYIADEYLQLTQTEHGTRELSREPGRSGDYGWTERDGLVLRKP